MAEKFLKMAPITRIRTERAIKCLLQRKRLVFIGLRHEYFVLSLQTRVKSCVVNTKDANQAESESFASCLCGAFLRSLPNRNFVFTRR